VNGFDERFFMYMEDVDLCARLGAAGFRLRYVPHAVAVHHWGASTARSPGRMLRHAYLSRVAYFDKHFPGWGGGVAGALVSLELALGRRGVEFPAALLRRDAAVDVAAVPRLRPRVARAGPGAAGRDGGARGAPARGRAHAPRRDPRDHRALPAARGDALPRPDERRPVVSPGPRLVGRPQRAAVAGRAGARPHRSHQTAVRPSHRRPVVDGPARRRLSRRCCGRRRARHRRGRRRSPRARRLGAPRAGAAGAGAGRLAAGECSAGRGGRAAGRALLARALPGAAHGRALAAADRQDGGRRAPRVAARPPPPGDDPMTPQIAVVIPALNERENLALLLPALREVLQDLGVSSEIVVADGGSTDGSREVAARRGARVVVQ